MSCKTFKVEDYDPKHVTLPSCHYKLSFSRAILTAKIQMATKIFSTFSLTIDIEQFLIKTPICTNNFHRQIHTVSKVELSHVSIDTNFTTLSIFQELDFPKLYIQCEFPRRNGANFSLRRNPWVFGNDRHRIPCNRPVLAFRKRLCLVFQSILKLIKKHLRSIL